jgi:hypothetical protein
VQCLERIEFAPRAVTVAGGHSTGLTEERQQGQDQTANSQHLRWDLQECGGQRAGCCRQAVLGRLSGAGRPQLGLGR